MYLNVKYLKFPKSQVLNYLCVFHVIDLPVFGIFVLAG